jgi:peptide deformylase
MIRPIILYGDSSLTVESTEIKKDSEVQALISDLFETMHKANGIGLAAVQIGIPLNIFVIEAHLEKENFHFREVFINPHIIRKFGNLVKHPEGCLSIPQIAALVERPSSIEIEWWNEKWEYQKQVFDNFAARIIQHEYDHLSGELFVDKLDKMWREMISISLALIEERNMEIPYLYK